MSVIGYRPLATVRLAEEGRSDGLAVLVVEPTPATRRALANHRLHFRRAPGGFRLFAEHDLAAGGAALVPIPAALPLLFAIRSTDPGFLTRFTPESADKAGPNLFLSNRTATGDPQVGSLSRGATVAGEDIGRIVPRRLRARLALDPANRADRVEVRAHFGGEKVGEPIPVGGPADSNSAEVTVDVGSSDKLAFMLTPKPAGTKQLIVADDELARLAPRGAIELVLKPFPGPAPAEGRAFSATFKKREQPA
jgi:hypothetical protein